MDSQPTIFSFQTTFSFEKFAKNKFRFLKVCSLQILNVVVFPEKEFRE
jgi:hypothetical protein